MIRHHIAPFEQKKQITFQIDEKKLVKTFIYHNQKEWIQYFTGFLFMEPNNQGKVDLKIRFSRHPHLAEIEAGIRYPLQLYSDQQGLYTLIHQSVIKTVQKPEQSLIYLKIQQEGKIIAISFNSKSYCKALLQHLTLMLENNESDEMTWTEQNLEFLNASMKQNLMYVDSVFILQERIFQFCNFFNKVDKKLYEKAEKFLNSQKQKYMLNFFQIIKSMFIRGNDKIIRLFITKKYQFQTILKCLSYNPFGMFHFNYLKQFREMTVIKSSLNQLENEDFMNNYEMITKIKFLKDVAICTFIQISTEGAFNEILNQCHIKILQSLSNHKICLIEKLSALSLKDQYKYLCVFSQIWEIFKAVLQDAQTVLIKQMFYLEWIQNGMFSQTLSAMGRLLKKREISDIHPRFWQRWMESMNPMLSYQWFQSQKFILNHQNSIKQQETTDFMHSLIMILANCDSNTKILILDFVRVQVQISQNRKQISAKYLNYVFHYFIKQSFCYCNNENDIQKYIEFIQKIYIAQPIRTRHFIIENNFMKSLKVYFKDKFIFIMLLKLLKTFIEVGETDTFKYLGTDDFYDNVRQKYKANQHLTNITNSIFLSIFKAVQNMGNKEGKKYLYRIFFASELKIELNGEQCIKSNEIDEQKTMKRPIPCEGLTEQMDLQK